MRVFVFLVTDDCLEDLLEVFGVLALGLTGAARAGVSSLPANGLGTGFIPPA